MKKISIVAANSFAVKVAAYVGAVIVAAHSFAVPASAAEKAAPADTVMKIRDVRTVVVTESPQGISYTVEGTETDSTFIASYTHKYPSESRVHSSRSTSWKLVNTPKLGRSRWSMVFGGLGLGMVKAFDAPADMQLEMAKSFEIDWLYALGLHYRSPWKGEISFGMGFMWRNYRSTTAGSRMVGGKGRLGFEPWPEGTCNRHTALKTFALQFPLIYKQHTGISMFGSDLQLSAGAILGVSTYASVKSGWTEPDGRKVQQYSKDMGQRRVTVDVIAIVQPTNVFGWYVRYSPQTTLNNTAGQPRIHALSTGIMLVF